MADATTILNTLTASNIFDLKDVVAVVTGGGTVRVITIGFSNFLTDLLPDLCRELGS